MQQVKIVQSKQERETAFHIRIAVFVDEQGVLLKDELDSHEDEAEHVLAYENDSPVGTGRWRVVDGAAKLERICLLRAYRKSGLGRLLVGAMEASARAQSLPKALLHGQVQAAPFYEKLGYQRISQPFEEDGIMHVIMTKEL